MATKQLNLRASASSRWIACPASARLSAKMPYVEGGEAAKIGTAIHALAEHCFKGDLDPTKFEGQVFEGILMTEENCEFALEHLKAIWKIEDELGAGSVTVEKFIPYQDTQVCKVGGTTDVIGISKEKRKLIIADLKTGRGYVSEDSDQLKLYALSALNANNLYRDISTVELWIIQPHHGETRKHTMTTQELVDWEHYILSPASQCHLNAAKGVRNAINSVLHGVGYVNAFKRHKRPVTQTPNMDINPLKFQPTFGNVSLTSLKQQHQLLWR